MVARLYRLNDLTALDIRTRPTSSGAGLLNSRGRSWLMNSFYLFAPEVSSSNFLTSDPVEDFVGAFVQDHFESLCQLRGTSTALWFCIFNNRMSHKTVINCFIRIWLKITRQVRFSTEPKATAPITGSAARLSCLRSKSSRDRALLLLPSPRT